ncbi:MAG: hypothetical protein JST40_11130 [Armatimonadetes bacterium]|nr:hypothetical protein [Armatimonadota bacterium]
MRFDCCRRDINLKKNNKSPARTLTDFASVMYAEKTTMTCLLLALTIAFQPAPETSPIRDGKVTYTHKADNVIKILEDFSKKTGLQLEAGKTLANTVLLIDVADIPLQDFYSRLASECEAEWTTENGKLFLKQLARNQVRKSKAEVEQTAKRLREGIDKLKKQVPTDQTDEQLEKLAKDMGVAEKAMQEYDGNGEYPWQKYQKLQSQQPIRRAAVEIISQLSIEQLAQMLPGDRLVFTYHPTRMQRQLPANSQQVFKKYLDQQAKYSIYQQQVQREMHPEWYGSSGDDFTPVAPITDARDVSLVIALPEALNSPANFQIKFQYAVQYPGSADDTPQALPANYQAESFDLNLTEMDPETFADLEKNYHAPEGGDKPLELSAETQVYIDALKAIKDPAKRTKEQLDLIGNPQVYEPLSYLPSEILLTYSKWKKAQVLLKMSDMLWMLGGWDGFFEKTLAGIDKFMTVYREFHGLEIRDGWLIQDTKQVFWDQLPKTNLNRSEIGKVIRASIASGDFDLDSFAELVAHTPREDGGSLSLAEQVIRSSGITQNQYSMERNYSVLRFYGSLTPDQRKLLRDGGSIRYGSLDNAQREAAFQLVFGADARLKPLNQENVPVQSGDDSFYEYGIYSDGNPGSEPTTVWPTGFPDTAVITGKAGSSVLLRPIRPNQDYFETWTINTAGQQLYYFDHPEKFEWIRDQEKPTKFSIINTSDMYFSIPISKTLTAEYRMRNLKPAGNSQSLSLNELPTEIQAAIKKSYDEAAASYKDYTPGQDSIPRAKPKP